MAINLNTEPYNDDFDEEKNFYQILFKPSLAVQARELTQLQTILRDQIKKFGNHIFRHGSVVIPGNSFADLAVPYIRLQDQFESLDVNTSNFDNKTIVGATSGVEAVVKKIVGKTQTDPITFYLSYTSGSPTTGAVTFVDGEEIYVKDAISSRATLQVSNATGLGSLAFINRGVYYVNGSFVFVNAQSTVISKYDSVPSCKVLLRITEEVIDFSEDETLLDNAQGSYNFAAPGADRLKIALTLTTLPLSAQVTDDYIEIMRYNAGVLEEHAKNAKYSELEKSLARRTFDESGNYIVEGLNPTVREHLKQNNNGGLFIDGDIGKLAVEISAGKGYIGGFEVEKLAKTTIVIDKARTSDHIKNVNITLRPEFGQYILVSNIAGAFSVYDRQTVDIYNDDDQTNASATKIGTAKVVSIDYYIGDPSSNNAIYKVCITDLSLIGTYTIDQAGGIRYGAGGYAKVITEYSAPVQTGSFSSGQIITHASSGRTATVRYWDSVSGTLYAYKHDHTKLTPNLGDLVVNNAGTPTSATITKKTVVSSVGQPSLLFRLPKNIPSTLRNSETNNYDLEYTVQKELVIITNSSGAGSVSVSSGTINPIEVGTFVAINSSGIVSNNLFSLNPAGTTLSITGGPTSSTIKVYAAVNKDGVSPKTKSVGSNSETIKYWVASTAFSLGDRVWYGNNLYTVTIAGTTSNVAPTHTSGSDVNGTVTFTYLSSIKNITLEKTDIIGITSIIDSVGDVTANYTVWNGQTDYAYNRGVVYLKAGRSLPSGNFVISYTYYEHSIAGDFFSIDSYSSVAGFLDKRVVYTSDSTSQVYDLGACLDFRPSVASDGTFTTSGSRRNDLIINGTTFNSSLQFYVPRIDTVTIDSSGKISVVKGIPNEVPTAPSVSSNQFELNRLYIPEYTRVSSDVSNTRLDVERFLMSDIQAIIRRIENLEDFATLTASELEVTRYDVSDAETGLSRFKTGYLVESFVEPFTIARTTYKDYASSFLYRSITSPVESLLCNLELLDSSSNYVIKNGFLMLPYTETPFASQPLSSRVTNINPFLVVRWDGVLNINPPADDWVEVRNLPTLFENKTDSVEVVNYIPCPPPPAPPSYAYDDGGGNWSPPPPKPAPTVTLNTYKVTNSPGGYSYTTVGAVGGYQFLGTADWNKNTTVEIIGSTQVVAGSGRSTQQAIVDYAARTGSIATQDAYQAAGLSGSYVGPNAMANNVTASTSARLEALRERSSAARAATGKK